MTHSADRKHKATSGSGISSRAHPAVDDHHVEGVGVEPALHGLTDGADLIQRRSVHVRPARVQRLKTQR